MQKRGSLPGDKTRAADEGAVKVHGSWARLGFLDLSLVEPPLRDAGGIRDLSRGLHSHKTPAQGADGLDSICHFFEKILYSG